MKKYIAKQILPEYQESPLMMEGDNWEGTWLEGLCIWGNPNYNERKSPELENLFSELEHLTDDYKDIKEQSGYSVYKTFPEAVKGFFPDYNGNDWKAWEELCEDFISAGWEFKEDIICKGLALLTGKEYHCKHISGYCQGDWQILYYPVKEWNENALTEIEAQYFNTGKEWLVSEEPLDEDTKPEDIAGINYYTIGWNDEQTQQELADMVGCKLKEIVMYKAEKVILTSYIKI